MLVFVIGLLCFLAFATGFYFGTTRKNPKKCKDKPIKNQIPSETEDYYNFLSYNGDPQ